MFNRVCLAFFVLISSLFQGGGLAANDDLPADEGCGEISIASTNWASAEIIAEIDKIILSAGYGCTIVLSGGVTMPTFANLIELGTPDLIPEVWVNSVQEQLDAAVDDGQLFVGAEVLADGGEEGWWIPHHLAEEHPDIVTVADALARPDLFSLPDDPAIKAVFNCPPDWPCRTAMENLFRALGAEEHGFTLVNTGTAAGLDASIARAHENKSGWLGYYWAPNAILGRYDMVKLDMGEHNPEQWRDCIVVPECENPKVNAWPENKVFSIFTEEFAEKASMAVDYISNRQWSNSTVNEVLAWMEENQATGEEVAYHFLESYGPIWSAWVPAEVVTKVKNRL